MLSHANGFIAAWCVLLTHLGACADQDKAGRSGTW